MHAVLVHEIAVLLVDGADVVSQPVSQERHQHRNGDFYCIVFFLERQYLVGQSFVWGAVSFGCEQKSRRWKRRATIGRPCGTLVLIAALSGTLAR